MKAGGGLAPWRRDMLAGFCTALMLSTVLIFVPTLLARAGMDFAGAYAACTISAIVGSALMGYLRLPLAAAPSAALALWLVMIPVISHGLDWRTLLAAGTAASAAFLVLLFALTRPRAQRLRFTVPPCIAKGLAGGVGLMLIFAALGEGRLLIHAPAGLLQVGDLHDPVAGFSLVGAILVLALLAARVRLAVFFAMASVAGLSFLEGFWIVPDAPFFEPAGLDRTALQFFYAPPMDGVLWSEAIGTALVLLLFLALDGCGALAVLAQGAPQGEKCRALAALGTVSVFAGALGSLPLTAAPESAVGQSLGGSRRMGYWAAVFLVPLLFLAPTVREMASFPALFVPALVGAGLLLLRRASGAFSGDFAEQAAAGLLFLLVPLTKSLALAIGTAWFMLVFLKCMAGRAAEVSLPARILAAIFLLYWYLALWSTF